MKRIFACSMWHGALHAAAMYLLGSAGKYWLVRDFALIKMKGTMNANTRTERNESEVNAMVIETTEFIKQ